MTIHNIKCIFNNFGRGLGIRTLDWEAQSSFDNNLQHSSWKVNLLRSKNALTIQNQAICFKD